MWFTPSSTARRSTPIERSRSLGTPRSNAALPVRRMAPNPSRLTVRSPSFQVPAAAAVIVSEAIGQACHMVVLATVDLIDRWLSALPSRVDPVVAREVGAELLARWAEEHRWYHPTGHLAA